MPQRLASAVLALLLSLQIVIFAPAAFAAALPAAAETHAGHCQDEGSQNEGCPCCPDGNAMLAGCIGFFTACTLASNIGLPLFQPSLGTVTPFIGPATLTRTYAPPNPPPIG